MRTLLFAMTGCACLVFFADDALAFAPGGGNSGNSQGSSGQSDKENFRKGNNQNSDNQGNQGFNNQGNQGSNTQGSKKAKNNRDNNDNGPNVGRGSFVNRNEPLGDQGFDKHHVGSLDESKYKNRRDNNWRYRHWGDEWWYWVPDGYWMYWHNGNWVRYDDTYVDASATQPGSSGPYYEDDKGFYSMQNGHRVYDPEIRRIANK